MRKLSLEVVRNTLEEMLEVPLDIPDSKTSEATPLNGEISSFSLIENTKFSIKMMHRRKSCHCRWCGGKSHFQDEIEKNPWVIACANKAKELVPVKSQMRSPHTRERSNTNRVGGRISQRKTIYISSNPAVQAEKKSIFLPRNSTNRTPTSIFRSSIRLESPLKKEKDESISESKESLAQASEENISEWHGHHEKKFLTLVESQRRKGSNGTEDLSRAKLRPFTMVQNHGIERVKKGPLVNLLLTQVQSLERSTGRLGQINPQNLEEDSSRNTSFFDLRGCENPKSITTVQMDDDERRRSELYIQKAAVRGPRLFGTRQETTISINLEENSPKLKPLGKHKIQTEVNLPERSEKRFNTFTQERSETKLKKILGISTLGRKDMLDEIGKITKSDVFEESKLLKSPVNRHETAERRGTDFLKKKNASILKMYAVDGTKSLRNLSTTLEPLRMNETYKGFSSPVNSCKSDNKRDSEMKKIKLRTKSKRKIIELSQTFFIKKV